MLVAIPVKTDRDDPAISPLFGHAKWFAFVKEGSVKIEKNPFDGGIDVVQWLLHRGVDAIITQHIGLKPFVLLKKEGVKIFYPGGGRITLSEALQALQKGLLQEITESNINDFAKHPGHH